MKVWKCPWCGYAIDDTQYMSASHDFECPSCRKKNLHEFISETVILVDGLKAEYVATFVQDEKMNYVVKVFEFDPNKPLVGDFEGKRFKMTLEET